MGTKLKYTLTFVFLMLSVLVFSVASVMAAAKVTVKNSVELNFVPCYTLLTGSQFNSRIPGSCTSIVFDKLDDEEGNVKPEYTEVIENSIYTTSVAMDGSQNVYLYFVDSTAYILSKEVIKFPKNCYNMFNYLNMVETFSFNNIDTSNVENMSAMFANCSSVVELDLSKFSTVNVNNFSSMFFKCTKLETVNLTSFNTQKAEYLSDMFSCCENMETIELNFNTVNVKKMSQMFFNCYSLTTLNISSFSTENVSDLSSMFYGCYSIQEIDISNFSVTSLEKTGLMFSDCILLKKIYVGENWNVDVSKITYSANMFYNCINLKFGDGSRYDSTKTDINYAIVGDSGYLSLKTI